MASTATVAFVTASHGEVAAFVTDSLKQWRMYGRRALAMVPLCAAANVLGVCRSTEDSVASSVSRFLGVASSVYSLLLITEYSRQADFC